ncbi:hypothetical protein BV22DRAFT_932909 [Leucogyrophana mollusca]|uniref:Uncharacterized protein n=1 Tax=Leucogyrophana mollusca TaxID=85980 RepID=A0ACB8AXC7_9AGAM|nr:hypothetical protein BV22DRAFT_932909 [Leucogyrophana mollusca]
MGLLLLELRLSMLLRGHFPPQLYLVRIGGLQRERDYLRKGVEAARCVIEGLGTVDVEAAERAVPGRGGELALKSNALREGMPLAVDHALLAISCSPSLLLVRQHGIGAEDTRDRRAPTATAEYVRLPRRHCARHCGGWTGVVCTVTPEPSPPGNDVRDPRRGEMGRYLWGLY